MQRTGSVEELKSGRWSVRYTGPDGKRRRGGETYATEAEAIAVVEALVDATDGTHRTLAAYGPHWLDARELAGTRSAAGMRSVWRTWIADAPIARVALRLLGSGDVRRWIGEVRGKCARQTASNALTVLRRCLAAAVDEGLLAANPAIGVTVPGGDARTEEPWTYLEPAEIAAILEAARGDARDVIAFAIGAGLRAGELCALRLADVRLDGDSPHVIVRYGRPPARPTKTGKIRRVPLFGLALAAVHAQVERLPADSLLLWPALRGGYRSRWRVLGREHVGKGRYVEAWRALLDRAGITRTVRWHDLRHTCASACVSGWWGRRWSLAEVAALLGHSQITTAQRYAHLGESALTEAARATSGPIIAQGLPRPIAEVAPPGRFGRPTNGLGTARTTERSRALAPSRGQTVGLLLRAIAAGDDTTTRAVGDALARDVLATEGALVALAARVLADGPDRVQALVSLADALDASLSLALPALDPAAGAR